MSWHDVKSFLCGLDWSRRSLLSIKCFLLLYKMFSTHIASSQRAARKLWCPGDSSFCSMILIVLLLAVAGYCNCKNERISQDSPRRGIANESLGAFYCQENVLKSSREIRKEFPPARAQSRKSIKFSIVITPEMKFNSTWNKVILSSLISSFKYSWQWKMRATKFFLSNSTSF